MHETDEFGTAGFQVWRARCKPYGGEIVAIKLVDLENVNTNLVRMFSVRRRGRVYRAWTNEFASHRRRFRGKLT